MFHVHCRMYTVMCTVLHVHNFQLSIHLYIQWRHVSHSKTPTSLDVVVTDRCQFGHMNEDIIFFDDLMKLLSM